MTKLSLENIRVLDFTHVWAGPMLAGALGDLGAQVIKIESRTRLDLWRTRPGTKWQDIQADKVELCPGFHNVNANKLSITLNLKKTESIELIKRLAAQSDIVCENMTAGTMDKLGIGYEDLKKMRDDIIYVSSCSFGQKGELGKLPGYGPTMQAMSGFDFTIGYRDEKPLGLFAVPFSDGNAGTQMILAVMAALYHRKKTGKGMYIDSSQVEGLMCLVGWRIISALQEEATASPDGNYHPNMAPYNFYPCAGDDQWVSIAVGTQQEWRDFCTAAGQPGWVDDPRFSTAQERVNNHKILDEMISAWTAAQNRDDIVEMLQKSNVAAAPMLDPREFEEHPFFRDRGTFVSAIHPVVGEENLFGSPWRIEGVSREVRLPAPQLGEHNEYVLGEILGMSRDEIAKYVEDKIIY